jgi:hypothetical protein
VSNLASNEKYHMSIRKSQPTDTDGQFPVPVIFVVLGMLGTFVGCGLLNVLVIVALCAHS